MPKDVKAYDPADRLRDILTELGYRNNRGFEVQLLTRLIQRESSPSWPTWRLRGLLEGKFRVSAADMQTLSEALRFDIRLFFYPPDQIPNYRLSKPRLKSIWDRLPPSQ